MENEIPENPYKKQEFETFLNLIKSPQAIAHWIEIANSLGIDKDTITVWKKHPRAIIARIAGIKKAIGGMERAGKDDWRMYEAKLKMLGFLTSLDLTSGGEKLDFNHLTDEQLDKLIAAKAGKAGVVGSSVGEGETPSQQPA